MVGLLLICFGVIAFNYFKSDKTEKGENAEAPRNPKFLRFMNMAGPILKKSGIRCAKKIGEPSDY